MVAIGTYEVLKFAHVLLAIVAVGFNATYAVWLARAAREPEHEAFALRGVKLLDDRIANPAYALLLVTGLSMVWVGDLDLAQFWLLTALVLYVVAVGLGLYYADFIGTGGARVMGLVVKLRTGVDDSKHDRLQLLVVRLDGKPIFKSLGLGFSVVPHYFNNGPRDGLFVDQLAFPV